MGSITGLRTKMPQGTVKKKKKHRRKKVKPIYLAALRPLKLVKNCW